MAAAQRERHRKRNLRRYADSFEEIRRLPKRRRGNIELSPDTPSPTYRFSYQPMRGGRRVRGTLGTIAQGWTLDIAQKALDDLLLEDQRQALQGAVSRQRPLGGTLRERSGWSKPERTRYPGVYTRGNRFVAIFRDAHGRQRKRAAATFEEAKQLHRWRGHPPGAARINEATVAKAPAEAYSLVVKAAQQLDAAQHHPNPRVRRAAHRALLALYDVEDLARAARLAAEVSGDA